ncbi:MAG: hypothetical protein ACP5D2_00700 [Candidatus Nanoarchaeia archaeon]
MVEYNLPQEKGRDRFQWYEGRNIDQMPKLMPKLIADGRVPMNTAQLMQRRLDMRNSDEEVKSAWMGNYFDTGDAVVYHPNGRAKIVFDSEDLRNMTPSSPRNGGALVVGEDVYNALEGEEFKKGKLGKVNEIMSREDVKSHPVWKVLARDQTLLNDYTDYIFGEYQARFDNNTSLEDIRAMGVFPSSCRGDKPEMRAWYVYGLGGRSNALGGSDLDLNDGRFVGIAPEALSAQGKGASSIKSYGRLTGF